MKKQYINGTHLCYLSTGYFNVVSKIYCTFKIERIGNNKNFVILSFLGLSYMKGHILNVFRTVFAKLLFHQ